MADINRQIEQRKVHTDEERHKPMLGRIKDKKTNRQTDRQKNGDSLERKLDNET